MDTALLFLTMLATWQVLRVRYQRARITLLGRHVANFQLERHMETLTQGYTRAIQEDNEGLQQEALETFRHTEDAVAVQVNSLASAMQKESAEATRLCTLPFCIPYAERFLPMATRDFRELLQIHAAGLRYVADNEAGWNAKDRAYHLSAELYLFQHSCHWFCKSRSVADARLAVRHQVKHQKVLESVSDATRNAYLRWMRGNEWRQLDA